MIRIAEPLTALSHELLEKRTSFPVESEEAAGSMLVVGGQAGSGAGFNAVPGSAWFSVDRRFNPEEDLEQELARLTGMIEEAAEAVGATVDVDVLQKQPSGSTEQSHPAAQALARCVAAVEGAEPSFQMCPGVSTHAGTHSSASRPLRTAAAAWTSPTAPTSTSTRPPCAAAPPSTRSSRTRCRDPLDTSVVP
jgi:acetylornithine deacetylase/succinyl-diaminopimelate desuccinylase-like protein